MMEKEIWNWLLQNWQSVLTGIIAASVYVRLNRYAERLVKLEKRQRRIMVNCAEVNPDRAKALFDDGNGDSK